MRSVFVSCFIALLSIAYTSSVIACGGGGPFTIQELVNTDIIVHAHVIEVDDRGYNAILQTDYYFKGQNNKYLVVDRFSPALEFVSAVRGYDTSCTYSGGGEKWVAGSEGYFGLFDNGNGTFSDTQTLYQDLPHFVVQDGKVEFSSFDINKDAERHVQSLSINEFEALLLQYGDKSKPEEPIPSAYPLKRFLNITTQSGKKYQLNPDRSVAALDPKTSLLAISNDGSHVVFKLDNETLGFQYLALKPETEEHRDGGWLIPQTGEFAIFSPNSNFVAVQELAHFKIYMFDNYVHSGYGQAMSMNIVARKDAKWGDNEVPIFWSGDSTSIAYQDKQGIWVWDIFEAAEPTLVVRDTADLKLLDVSNSGRYVRYKVTDKWILLDISTGKTFENAIATPDESNLIYIQAEYPEGTLDINRQGGRSCHTPLSQSCPIYILGSNNLDFFWYKYDQIALLSCGEQICHIATYPWQLSIGNTYNYGTQLDMQIPLVSAFDYDITYDKSVVALKDYTLEFGFYASWLRDEPGDSPIDIDTVDLSRQLDSPIIHLEWGQPIFLNLISSSSSTERGGQ